MSDVSDVAKPGDVVMSMDTGSHAKAKVGSGYVKYRTHLIVAAVLLVVCLGAGIGIGIGIGRITAPDKNPSPSVSLQGGQARPPNGRDSAPPPPSAPATRDPVNPGQLKKELKTQEGKVDTDGSVLPGMRVGVDNEERGRGKAQKDKDMEFLKKAKANPKQVFDEWKAKYRKTYESAEDEELHFDAWKKTMKKVQDINEDAASTHWASLDDEYADFIPSDDRPYPRATGAADFENTISSLGGNATVENPSGSNVTGARRLQQTDYKGVVSTCWWGQDVYWDSVNTNYQVDFRWLSSPIRDQGSCQSSVAFATAGLLEIVYAIQSGNKRVDISEQQFMDCAPKNSSGAPFECSTFVQPDAFLDWVQYNGAAGRDSYKPYASARTACDADRLRSRLINIGSTYSSRYLDERFYANRGSTCFWPFLAVVNANNLQYYRGGIISGNSNPQPNHAVVVVGYGKENNIPYWIVRNSWGAGWGERGYFRIRRNANQDGIGILALWSNVGGMNQYVYDIKQTYNNPGYEHTGFFYKGTAEECATACEQQPTACNAWAFDWRYQRCWLKWAAPDFNYQYHPDLIVGVRSGSHGETPGTTPWGSWSVGQRCGVNHLAYCAVARVEGDQGGGDDTAMNGFQMYCTDTQYLKPHDGYWGGWGKWQCCPKGQYITAVRLQVEPFQGGGDSGDDTAANNWQAKCSGGGILQGDNGMWWGDWQGWRECPAGEAVCALSNRVQGSLGDGKGADDTALNSVWVQCCRVESPTKPCP